MGVGWLLLFLFFVASFLGNCLKNLQVSLVFPDGITWQGLAPPSTEGSQSRLDSPRSHNVKIGKAKDLTQALRPLPLLSARFAVAAQAEQSAPGK